MAEQKPDAIVKIAEASLLAVNEQTVASFLNDKLTKPEMALFLNLCAMFQLNPFKREVYPIKYKANDPASFVIGYETYLKRAERTKNWAGLESGAEIGANDVPKKAWARVFRKDWGDRPLYHEVYFQEYVQMKAEWVNGQSTGKKVPNKMWTEKPITMLKKVAIAQAMRMAFPDEMAGLPYIEEELHLGEPGSIEAKASELKERSEYEALKRQPLKDITDEFGGPPLATQAPAPAAPKPGPAPSEPAMASALAAAAKALTPRAAEPPKADPAVDLVGEAEAAALKGEEPEPAGPSLKQLEKFAKLKVEMKLLGIDEERMWGGIKKFSQKTLGRAVETANDLGEPEMEMVLGYLNRWRGILAKEQAEKEAADGKR